jgi:hypothetical protein
MLYAMSKKFQRHENQERDENHKYWNSFREFMFKSEIRGCQAWIDRNATGYLGYIL